MSKCHKPSYQFPCGSFHVPLGCTSLSLVSELLTKGIGPGTVAELIFLLVEEGSGAS